MFKRIVCTLLAVALCTVTVFAQPEAVVVTVPDTQGMSVGADAAILMEAKTGRILFAQNVDERLPFASTTKIMTALLALEQPQADAQFVVDPAAIKVEGSSMGLTEGDQVTLRTLAVGMLLASGNDAANAAAVRISGSIPAFVELMNSRAKELGLENTSFETPSGLDGENHYSSARDLALLARAALKHDEFREICGQYRMRASYGNPPYDRWLTNHNRLLNYCEGAIGLKTGFTKKAGRCLVSAVNRDGVELICVTLNCPDDWDTHKSLYDRFSPTLEVEDLARSMPSLRIPVTGGDVQEVEAVTYDTSPIPVPVNNPDIQYRVKVFSQFLYAPVNAGQPVGEALVTLEGEPVATLTLVAGRTVPLKHPYEEKTGFLAWLLGLLPD